MHCKKFVIGNSENGQSKISENPFSVFGQFSEIHSTKCVHRQVNHARQGCKLLAKLTSAKFIDGRVAKIFILKFRLLRCSMMVNQNCFIRHVCALFCP
jgi:hypothetical protein